MTISPVTSPGGLLLAIRSVLPGLNEQEQKVGQYVLDHPAETIHLSMTDLATRCAVRDTTVFPFCRKIGTEGYQDFKIRLALELLLAAPLSAFDPGDGLGGRLHILKDRLDRLFIGKH